MTRPQSYATTEIPFLTITVSQFLTATPLAERTATFGVSATLTRPSVSALTDATSSTEISPPSKTVMCRGRCPPMRAASSRTTTSGNGVSRCATGMT